MIFNFGQCLRPRQWLLTICKVCDIYPVMTRPCKVMLKHEPLTCQPIPTIYMIPSIRCRSSNFQLKKQTKPVLYHPLQERSSTVHIGFTGRQTHHCIFYCYSFPCCPGAKCGLQACCGYCCDPQVHSPGPDPQQM